MKYKILITSLLITFQSLLNAHNPLQSSINLKLYEHNGILEINLAQYGVEQALLKKYPDLEIASMPSNDFKEVLINYLKESILIKINDQDLIIGKGVIKLGSHQTDLKFQIDNVPESPEFVHVNAHCFQENEKQQNFFKIEHKGIKAKKKLNHANNFSIQFTIADSQILEAGNSAGFSVNNKFWIGIALFSILLLLFSPFKLLRKKAPVH